MILGYTPGTRNTQVTQDLATLRKTVRQADAAYRAGTPLLSDRAFDALFRRLAALAPDCPEVTLPGGGTKLLSLDNIDLQDWLDRLGGTMPHCTVTTKIDGCALALVYQDGQLTQAVTRSGQDALAVARLVGTIPQEIRCSGRVLVRGELYDHETGKQSEPAAALRRKVAQADNLSFAAFELMQPGSLDHTEQLSILEQLGFLVHPWHVITTKDQAKLLHRTWQLQPRSASLPSDGLVLRINDQEVCQTLGCSTRAPMYALALK